MKHRFFHALFHLALVFATLVALTPAVYAQNYVARIGGPYGRIFPEQARRGTFEILQYPLVEIDGKRERMVPGTRLVDTNNRTVTPASYTGKRMVVNFVRFANGQLHTVWMLTAKERRDRSIPLANPTWWERFKKSVDTAFDLTKWLALKSVL